MEANWPGRDETLRSGTTCVSTTLALFDRPDCKPSRPPGAPSPAAARRSRAPGNGGEPD
eukprot:CAMPEP_0198554862 /NCGR_PEP_ID=MMETSP1462-20131121/83506_1 /TAXON_ID=1333877 /ORGANISM="Brandtodinium nutriculum, Strain RCC3387" /LENGTH=58 /DNA_ID=CAMNT_0044285585 /DNA_START=12 /DNA_END=185 /DNA_ORIENTATION=+